VHKDRGSYADVLQFYDLALDCEEKVTGVGDRFLKLCSSFGATLDECGEILLSNEYFQLGAIGSKLNRHSKSRFKDINATNYFDLILEEEKNQIDWLSRDEAREDDKDTIKIIKNWRAYCEKNSDEVTPKLKNFARRVERLRSLSKEFHKVPETEHQKYMRELRESVQEGKITAEEARLKVKDERMDVLSSVFDGGGGDTEMQKRIEEAEKKALKRLKSKDKDKRIDDLKGFFE
jgi:hypothetical protein